MGGESGLCSGCEKRKERTDTKVAQITGTSLQGTHPSYLHGIVSEPVPFWSHIYDGAWFRLKVNGGAIVSEENMAKAKKVAAGLPELPEAPVASEAPVRKKKVLVAATATATATATPAAKPRKIAPKKIEEIAPMAALEKPVEVHEVLRIEVKKVEVGGRSVYYDSRTQKVYDLKCKYIGRLREDEIVSFPDSDKES